MTQVKKKRNLVWLNKYIFKILICFTVFSSAEFLLSKSVWRPSACLAVRMS
jgi:hypothetical protein